MNINLSGKIALITGGSRGIGRETGRLLAEAGATVIINYNKSLSEAEKTRDEIISAGGTAEIIKADMSKPDEIESLFNHIKKTNKRLDILVNNAGIIKDMLLPSMELSDWQKVMDVNLKSVFLCTKYAVEMMMPLRSGKIINLSSVSAVRGGRGQTNYAASKGGIISFTRACAVELSGKGIQFNAVLPGFINTDMSSRTRKRAGDAILQGIPAGRFGEPSDVAKLIVFLASDHADYITGQTITVDGGLSIT
jgi:3-oxoacyl-[acyl-carrier protein] reductase